jgi:HD-GYP domain-containing protein (c-di-GMP phosphodiesterase class II)
MALLLALSKAIEARDPYALGHAARVTGFAEAIAARLDWDRERRHVLRLGGVLHDVGKLAVPEELLCKPGPLTSRERAEIRKHPRAGATIVWSVASLRAAIPGVLFHHERWDGSGYPTGREAEEIPAEARILAVADSFDAMTSDRPYRSPVSEEDALAEIERCAGRQFDPEAARAFVEAWEAGVFRPASVAQAVAF